MPTYRSDYIETVKLETVKEASLIMPGRGARVGVAPHHDRAVVQITVKHQAFDEFGLTAFIMVLEDIREVLRKA